MKRELSASEVPEWVRTLAVQVGDPPFKFSVPTLKNKQKQLGMAPQVFVTLVLWKTETEKFPRLAGHQPHSTPGFQIKCETLP